MIQRWCICDTMPDGSPSVDRYARAWRHRRELPGGKLLILAEFEADGRELDAAQTDQTIEMLPSLTAPASRLRPQLLARLETLGVTPQPGDTVLNVMRAVRDKLGFRFRVDLDS